jgi:hypothetical protein
MTCLELNLIDAGGDRTTDGSIRTYMYVCICVYMYVCTYLCTYGRPKERKRERKKENQKVGDLSLSLSSGGLVIIGYWTLASGSSATFLLFCVYSISGGRGVFL